LQQQQQQAEVASSMDMQQLKRMLVSAHGHTKATALMTTINLWSTACGSSDVLTLLQQPAALLQALRKLAPKTVARYLSGVREVLQLPAVAALLPAADLASLLEQLLAAKQQHQTRNRKKAQRTRSAAPSAPSAAAAAAPAVLHGSSLALHDLKGVLLATYEPSRATQLIIPFNVWSEQCKTDDVRSLLLHPKPLLQKLRRFYTPSCAVRYLDCVCEVLLLPQVFTLVSWDELQQLQQQLSDARHEFVQADVDAHPNSSSIAAAAARRKRPLADDAAAQPVYPAAVVGVNELAADGAAAVMAYRDKRCTPAWGLRSPAAAAAADCDDADAAALLEAVAGLQQLQQQDQLQQQQSYLPGGMHEAVQPMQPDSRQQQVAMASHAVQQPATAACPVGGCAEHAALLALLQQQLALVHDSSSSQQHQQHQSFTAGGVLDSMLFEPGSEQQPLLTTNAAGPTAAIAALPAAARMSGGAAAVSKDAAPEATAEDEAGLAATTATKGAAAAAMADAASARHQAQPMLGQGMEVGSGASAAATAAAQCDTAVPEEAAAELQHTHSVSIKWCAEVSAAAAAGGTPAVHEYAEHAAMLAASLADLQQQLALVDNSSSNSKEQHQCCIAGDVGGVKVIEPESEQQLVLTTHAAQAGSTAAAAALPPARSFLQAAAVTTHAISKAQTEDEAGLAAMAEDVIAADEAAKEDAAPASRQAQPMLGPGLEVGRGADDDDAQCSIVCTSPSEELDLTVDLAALSDAAADVKDTATAPSPTATAAAAAAAGPEQHRWTTQPGHAQQKQQQPQKQQLQRTTSASMDLEQLQQLLLEAWHDINGAASVMMPFRLWAAAVNSSDVATLLLQPAALLQLLGYQGFTNTTAAGYIRSVEHVLTLPAVAALLSAAELASQPGAAAVGHFRCL
jgi:hypothetical protein